MVRPSLIARFDFTGACRRGGLWWVCPIAAAASFSFLTPIFAVTMGHFLSALSLALGLLIGAALVGLGITLINQGLPAKPN